MKGKQKLKMTKENYGKILDMWKKNKNRDIKAVYHHSYISTSELFDQAYSKNITLLSTTNDTPFVTVSFESELIEI